MKCCQPEGEFTWAKLWRKDQLGILFLLRSVYDTLPSPVQLHQWGLVKDLNPSCVARARDNGARTFYQDAM